jgi:hypothetical protein
MHMTLLQGAEYLHLSKRDASFPQYHFAVLADEERARAYDAAITRQVARRKEHFMVGWCKSKP